MNKFINCILNVIATFIYYSMNVLGLIIVSPLFLIMAPAIIHNWATKRLNK